MTAYAAMLLLIGALPVCLYVIHSDLATMRIPNVAVLALAGVWIVLGLLAVLLDLMPLQVWTRGLVFGLIGLAISFVGLSLKPYPGLLRPLALVMAALPLAWLAVGHLASAEVLRGLMPYATYGWIIALAVIYAASIGGGDSKFAAAMAPFFVGADWNQVLLILTATLIVSVLAHRLCKSVPALRGLAPDWASWDQPLKKFPMGVTFAASLIIYLLAQVLPLS